MCTHCVQPVNSSFISTEREDGGCHRPVCWWDRTPRSGYHLGITAGTQLGWWQAPLLQTGCSTTLASSKPVMTVREVINNIQHLRARPTKPVRIRAVYLSDCSSWLLG